MVVECCVKREKVDDEDGRPFGPGWLDVLLGNTPAPADASKASTSDEGDVEESEAARSARALSRHVNATGPDPNLLVYMCSDAPASSSSASSSSTAATPPRKPRAFHLPPNTAEGVPIETDNFEGQVLAMYQPSSKGAPVPDNHPYAQYFASRKRNWEFRVQGRFKRKPTGKMFMGIVLRDFNYDQAVASYSKTVKNIGLGLVKYDHYMSWGDRCEAALKPDAELTHMVSDLGAWDQFIITPAGKEPPRLSGDLSNPEGCEAGQNLRRKEMGVAEFAKAIREALERMSTSDTFTMCFWGVSPVIDLLNWQFTFSRWTTFDMGGFFGDSPLHVAMYEFLPEDGDDPSDKRQLESRKRYYLDFMFWSNIVDCSKLADKYVFVDAPKEFESFSAELCGAGDGLIKCASFHTANGDALPTRWSRGSRTSEDLRRMSSRPRSSTWSNILSSWSDKLRWIPASTCSFASAPAHEDPGSRRPTTSS